MKSKTNLNENIAEKAALKGKYRITKAIIETKEQWALHDLIAEKQKQGINAIDLIRKLNQICRTEVNEVENLIPTAGRAAIANWLTNASPSPASILLNKVALGTGATAPANGDTQLQTETYRKNVESETNANNIAYVTAFYTAPEVSGTFLEAGIFMNGSAGANTGTLFSRVAINITKSSVVTLTIDYTITIS